MSQWDKLIKRLYTIPGDMRFEYLKKIYVRMVKDIVEKEMHAK
jgi:hypothetical protein